MTEQQTSGRSRQREAKPAFQYAYHAEKRDRSLRQISRRWLIGTLAVVLIGTPAVYFWHRYQLKRVATAMLARADQLESDGEYRKASDYLFRCLQLSPQDSPRHRELTVRIAKSYDRSITANTRSVISWYERAVAAEQDATKNDLLRTRLAELYLSVGEYQLSKSQASQLAKPTPRSQRVQKLCVLREFDAGSIRVTPKAVLRELESLEQSGSIELATAIARLYREHPEVLQSDDNDSAPEKADQIIDEMVDEAKGHAEGNDEYLWLADGEDRVTTYRALAHLARYQYQLRYSLELDREDDVAKALELAPHRPEVLLASARQAREQMEWATAIDRYRALLNGVALSDSQRSQGLLGLGEACQRSGDADEAIATWEGAIDQVQQGRLPILVRLVETLTREGQLEKAQRWWNELDSAVGRLEMYRQNANRDWATTARDLCDGRLKMARREYAEAALLLDRISRTTKRHDGRRVEESVPYVASILLGQCQLELQLWPEAAGSFERALEFAPQSLTARIWAAKAWTAAGRDRAAIDLCEQVIRGDKPPQDVWLMLAQLHLRDQLRLPPSDRDWDRLERVLANAATVLPDSWELPLVRSNLVLVRDGATSIGRVMQILAATESAHPNTAPLWSNLVFMYDRLQLPKEADRALAQLERLEPNSLKTQAWRIALLANRGQIEAAQRRLDVVANGQNQDETEHAWIDRARLFLAYRRGDMNEVRQVLQAIHQRHPQNVEVLVQLADLEQSLEHTDQARQWTEQLRAVEGERGIWWRLIEVRQRVASDSSATEETQKEVDKLYAELTRLRPWWAGTALARGLIAERQGRHRAASVAFAEAVQAGFDQPHVYEKLARSLYADGRFNEAGEWLLQLQQQQPLDVRLLGLAVSSARRQNQAKWAERLARENLKRHADDPLAHVWMAQVLALEQASEQASKEADELVARARALQPESFTAWMAMMSYYLQVGQLESAEECLAELEQMKDVPPGQLALVSAQANAQMGKSELARTKFQEAIAALPDDAEALLLFAQFEHAYDPPHAIELAEQAKNLSPENERARRLLYVWRQLDPESGTVVENAATDGVDDRLKVSVLIRKGGAENLILAQELLEKLVSQPTATDEDRLTLAYLYERTENIRSAREQFKRLVERRLPPAQNLAAATDFHLRHGDLNAAQRQLKRLEDQAAMTFSAASLRSRLFLAQGKEDLIDAHLDRFARQRLGEIKDTNERRYTLRQVAKLFAALKRREKAEQWFGRLCQEFPQHDMDFAAFWIQSNDIDRAVSFAAERIDQELTAETAALYAGVLVHADPKTTDWERVEEVLSEAYRQNKSDAKLLFSLASLRIKQGDTDAAIQLLQELTERHPLHVSGWNNLAAILADDPARLDEALDCITRAINAAGRPIANLLDTKAVILLLRNENDAAAQLLQQVLALPRANDPRFHFHLAVARQRLGRSDEAKQAWQMAIKLGLAKTYLTPYEQQLAEQLVRAFGGAKVSVSSKSGGHKLSLVPQPATDDQILTCSVTS